MTADGTKIGARFKANPVLEPLRHVDEQLGYTAEQARLSRRSRGQGARDDAIAAALMHDARLREADKARRRLPPADPEVLSDGKP